MLMQINQAWANLNTREQYLVKALGLFLSLVLLYVIIWSPVQSSKAQAQQQLENAQTEWNWLNEQIPSVQSLQSTVTPKMSKVNNQTQLMALIQTSLKQQNLFKDIKTLQGTTQGGKIAFEKVNAMRLFKWLGQLEQQGLIADKLQTFYVEPGLVKADVQFKLPN